MDKSRRNSLKLPKRQPQSDAGGVYMGDMDWRKNPAAPYYMPTQVFTSHTDPCQHSYPALNVQIKTNFGPRSLDLNVERQQQIAHRSSQRKQPHSARSAIVDKFVQNTQVLLQLVPSAVRIGRTSRQTWWPTRHRLDQRTDIIVTVTPRLAPRSVKRRTIPAATRRQTRSLNLCHLQVSLSGGLFNHVYWSLFAGHRHDYISRSARHPTRQSMRSHNSHRQAHRPQSPSDQASLQQHMPPPASTSVSCKNTVFLTGWFTATPTRSQQSITALYGCVSSSVRPTTCRKATTSGSCTRLVKADSWSMLQNYPSSPQKQSPSLSSNRAMAGVSSDASLSPVSLCPKK